ncbi:GumC family protein [Caminicella sporogenes]|uniref:GumC family protein n=1 Tax=Caminicella sporogenes TaxID=166485 RepID=UPI001FA9049E|nr:GNVR domain-containing protein [Caminicella sporogenes]
MQYDEISLRELIEIILKQKNIIIGITIVSLLISFVVSFFVLDPVYEAKAVLMASQVTDKIRPIQKIEGIEGILDTISKYPQLTIETYKQQIKNPVILDEIIKELNLDKKGITRDSLANMIRLETIKDTNLITIKVQNTDKELATKIANTLSKKFIAFISEIVKEQANKSSNFISKQLEVEKAKLDKALLEYKNFLSQPRGVKELEKEIDSKLTLLTDYKTTLTTENVNELQLRAKLKQAQEELKNTEEKIKLNKSLSDEPYMAQVVNEKTQSTSTGLFNVTVTVEEKNDNYYSLKSQISKLKISLAESLAKQEKLKSEIEKVQKELETLQGELAEKKHKENLILRKVNIAQSTYDAFTKKLEEARIAQSSTIADSSIIIVSPAVDPIKPISPKKALNLAIAGVLGIMLGIFIAFFREYWKNSAVEKVSS